VGNWNGACRTKSYIHGRFRYVRSDNGAFESQRYLVVAKWAIYSKKINIVDVDDRSVFTACQHASYTDCDTWSPSQSMLGDALVRTTKHTVHAPCLDSQCLQPDEQPSNAQELYPTCLSHLVCRHRHEFSMSVTIRCSHDGGRHRSVLRNAKC